jgi:hypothetical protein
MREQTLMAQPFDARRLKLERDPAPIAENLEPPPNSPPNNPRAPFWTSDAGVLAYRNSHSFAVHALTWFDRQGPSFKVGVPKALFDVRVDKPTDLAGWPWDISPDGQRFLFNIPSEAQPSAPLTVVTNWRAKLKK